jgi:hypothetical protein
MALNTSETSHFLSDYTVLYRRRQSVVFAKHAGRRNPADYRGGGQLHGFPEHLYLSLYLLATVFVLTASTLFCEISGSHAMKITVFRDVAPCSFVGVDRRFRGAYCLYHNRRDVGESAYICNVGLLQQDYTALHPRRL